MKYIICQDFSGQPAPFIFPKKVAHADMRAQLPYGSVLAAGYVNLRNGKFECYGGDVDLGVSSRPEEDALCLHKFFEE